MLLEIAPFEEKRTMFSTPLPNSSVSRYATTNNKNYSSNNNDNPPVTPTTAHVENVEVYKDLPAVHGSDSAKKYCPAAASTSPLHSTPPKGVSFAACSDREIASSSSSPLVIDFRFCCCLFGVRPAVAVDVVVEAFVMAVEEGVVLVDVSAGRSCEQNPLEYYFT